MYSQNVPYNPLPTLAEPCNAEKTERRQTTVTEESNHLFELLLGAQLVGVAALALPAVGRTGRETGLRSLAPLEPVRRQPESPYIALAADHLVAVELGGESLERGLNDTTTQAEDEVEGRLLCPC
jgi:hypothetical protein